MFHPVCRLVHSLFYFIPQMIGALPTEEEAHREYVQHFIAVEK